MLTSSSRLAFRRTGLRLPTIASFHYASPVFKSAPQQDAVESSPINKFAQGINVIKSTILNAPPLRKITKPVIETMPFTGKAENWNDAVMEAQSLVSSIDAERIFDPIKIIGKDFWELKGNITQLLGSGHPFIKTVVKQYLEEDTHRIRPLLVLLLAKATCSAPKRSTYDPTRHTNSEKPIVPTQRRLAEISEMLYTSYLLHYDVKETDFGASATFGNKMAILAGDFLLARSSLALSELRSAECIELMATCIANLAEGEFMQLQSPDEKEPDEKKAFDYYMDKIYLKTGSLIAQSCKASAVLSGCTTDISNSAYAYGRHLGIAFQLMEDIRNFTASAAKLDLNGWATAPVLLAWEENPELGPLIQRQFKQTGDIEQARVMVYQTSGLKKTFKLVDNHIKKAIDSIEKLPPSDARLALVQLAHTLNTYRS